MVGSFKKYKLLISTKAKRSIRGLKKHQEDAVFSALEELEEDPFIGKPLNEELSGKLNFRVSEYRFIYKVNVKDKIVRVVSFDHRGVVYKKKHL